MWLEKDPYCKTRSHSLPSKHFQSPPSNLKINRDKEFASLSLFFAGSINILLSEILHFYGEQPIELKCHKRLLTRMRFFQAPADQQDRKPVNACDDQDGNGKK